MLGRHRPDALAITQFPQVSKSLKDWQIKEKISIAFFAISAFGMLETSYPEANTISESGNRSWGRIKDPSRWSPFGLVAPLYWLCTGEYRTDLR